MQDIYDSNFRPRHAVPEVLEKGSDVEVETYLSLPKMVQNFINAGLKVDAQRRYQYDIDNAGQDAELVPDPTRYQGFDVNTATRMSREVSERITKAKAQNVQPNANGAVLQAVQPATPPASTPGNVAQASSST